MSGFFIRLKQFARTGLRPAISAMQHAEPGSLLGKQKKSAADELNPEQPIAELIRGLLPLHADRHDAHEALCVADGVMTAGDLQSLDDEDFEGWHLALPLKSALRRARRGAAPLSPSKHKTPAAAPAPIQRSPHSKTGESPKKKKAKAAAAIEDMPQLNLISKFGFKKTITNKRTGEKSIALPAGKKLKKPGKQRFKCQFCPFSTTKPGPLACHILVHGRRWQSGSVLCST